MSGAARTALKDEAGHAKPPFRERFKAWWDGYELEPESSAGGSGGGKPDAASIVPEAFVRHSPAHLELMQAVWGAGHTTPGGDAGVLQLVKPFGLNPAMSVLEIGAGLGGSDRVISETFGVWVTGMEQDHALVSAGNELSKIAGKSRKVELQNADLALVEIKEKGFDCIFSKERFFTVEDKARLIQQIDNALRDQGQLLFTDYVASKPFDQDHGLDAWAGGEPEAVFPWTLDQYLDTLRGCEVDIRISEDITEQYRRTVTQGWAEFMTAQRGKPNDPRLSTAMVAEVELWTRRVQALESGALQVYRFYAIRKGLTKMLSDW